MKKPLRLYFVVFLLYLLITSCQSRKGDAPSYVIGFSNCTGNDAWRRTMLQEMQRELSFHPQLKLSYRDAQESNTRQVQQIKELIEQGVDLLIVSPNEAEPVRPAIELAFQKGIPVIMVDRKSNSRMYNAFVGADNHQIGKIAAQYAAQLIKGEGKILEISGLPGSTPAQGRSNGFKEALRAFPNIKITASLNGEWRFASARAQVTAFLKTTSPDFDLVYAHNDTMALGAYEAFNAIGAVKNVHFIGVDGLAGKNGGMQLVQEGILDATLLYPTGGGEAIRVALDILQHRKYKKEYTLQTTVIDKTNVRVMLMQADKINDQQSMIEREQLKIKDLNTSYTKQRNFLNILLISLLGAITTGIYIFYLLNEKQLMHKRLSAQFHENLEQKNQIAEIAEREEAAIQAKLQFFTNISHEFRTPLTLILTPLEELLRLPAIANNKAIFQDLSLVQKNALRLLRLIIQLMDFRKIESGQMKVSVSENDMVDFVRQIIQAFEKTAQQRHIDYRILHNRPEIKAWVDVNMIDKVLFNLLSNAFKFTNDHGKIFVSIDQDEELQQILIKVTDNGIGMSKETGNRIFERFFQGDNQKKYLGSGIGLALSKEFIDLHHGALTVISDLNKGTTFSIALQKGNAHFEAAEIIQDAPPVYDLVHNGLMHSSVLQDDQVAQTPSFPEQLPSATQYTLLIVEDNPELRSYLHYKLAAEFVVLLASNAQEAFEKCLLEVPDLVISDIMIAGITDGLALVREIKADLRTSHIPVVLLSALGNLEQQIGGMQTFADAYISKPFSFQLLDQTIKTILKNREILRDHFTAEVAGSVRTQPTHSKDKQFINEFMALIEENYGNPDYSVDKMYRPLKLSRVQLYRKVKALMNCSVAEYLTTVRLQKARQMLMAGQWTIAEVAYESGFSSPAYFSTAFKNKFGISPSEFMNAKLA